MTSQTAYYDCVYKVIENLEGQTGVEEWGIISGSKEQHQLVACLDFDDQLYPGAGCFNLCTGCGRSFGSKLWWDRDKGTGFAASKLQHLEVSDEAFTQKLSKAASGKCHWRCLVEWIQLKQMKESEEENKRKDGFATQMWDHMTKEF